MNRTSRFLQNAWRLLLTPADELGRSESAIARMRAKRARKKKRAPHGIALFTVLLSLALLSSIVTDLSYNEMVRYKLAAHDRDAMRAQFLAESGVQTARLLLSVQAAIQPMLTQLAQAGIPLPAHTVWDLIPLESDLLRSLTDGSLQSALGLDVSQHIEERALANAEKAEEAAFDRSEEAVGGPFEPPEGGFGAFDGNFSVKIEDEERKAVSLRGWQTANTSGRWATAQRIYTLFSPARYDFLFEERDSWGNRTDRYDLVANMFDWVDGNSDATDPRAEPHQWGRVGGGSEDGIYSSYDIEPKNDYFDSHAELRMIRGMSDAHMQAFGESISIYGENKINILSAPPQSIEALIRMCAQNLEDPVLFDPLWMRATVVGWMECKSMGMLLGGCSVSPRGFVGYLQQGIATNGNALLVNEDQCLENIATESKNFTVKATGTVGDVSRTIRLVLRVHGAIEERYFYSIAR